MVNSKNLTILLLIQKKQKNSIGLKNSKKNLENNSIFQKDRKSIM